MVSILCSVFRGILKISRLSHPPVTIFGGARLKADSIYMKKARELAHTLADSGIPVLTGGGPGIMEAASCGAFETNQRVITALGVTVPGLDINESPACRSEVIVIKNYAARKWLLIEYSIGYVVYPGGFGTINELTELLTLMQTKLHPQAPIILIGIEYWEPILAWLQDSALKNGLIAQEDIELFTVTDDIMQAYELLVRAHAHNT